MLRRTLALLDATAIAAPLRGILSKYRPPALRSWVRLRHPRRAPARGESPTGASRRKGWKGPRQRRIFTPAAAWRRLYPSREPSRDHRERFDWSRDARMNQMAIEDFAKYLANKSLLPATLFEPASGKRASAERSLRKLWEATELTANGFADEVAHFYGLKRLTLPQLVAAPSLAARFSPRFLRDTAVFPFEF